ncbi:MAG: hypothetical protein JNJ48_01975 [Phycisphaerae bacterium]|nr:hypothetical protein [Phycisphaerae bacterium]
MLGLSVIACPLATATATSPTTTAPAAVLPAPLVVRRDLDAAAACARDVVAENELELGVAPGQRALQPRVLLVAERDLPEVALAAPAVAGFWRVGRLTGPGRLRAANLAVAAALPLGGRAIAITSGTARPCFVVDRDRRVPVGVDHDEERIAPLPGEVVAEQADVLHGPAVAGVEAVGSRQGEVGRPRLAGEHGEVVGRAVEQIPGGLFVVAVDEHERRGAADDPEERALGRVDVVDRVLGAVALRGPALDDPLDAEIVAHQEMEVGCIGGDVGQRANVQVGIEHASEPLGVAVALHGEGEGGAGSPSRVEPAGFERAPRGAGVIAEADAVEDFGVRRKTVDGDVPRDSGSQRLNGGGAAEPIRSGAELDHRLGRQAAENADDG